MLGLPSIILFWKWRCETGLSPPVKYFTDRSKAVRYFFCGSFVFFCLVLVMPSCTSVYLYPCVHLLGKGWPLGSCLWCLIVSLSLSHWCPRSGVVLDCIYS